MVKSYKLPFWQIFGKSFFSGIHQPVLIGFLLFATALYSQGTCECYIPLDSTFSTAELTEGYALKDQGVAPDYRNDDGCTKPIKLPFEFCFYGQNYDTVFISNNGNLTVIKPIYYYVPGTGIPPGKDTAMLATFYSNVDTRVPPNHFGRNGLVFYKITPTHMIVKWDDVPYESFDCDVWDSYQLIITDGNDPILPAGTNVSFCYKEMGWATSDASGGFGGFGGTAATVGINKGNNKDFALFGTFGLPGSTYAGPFDPYNGVSWLDKKSFIFNTCVTANRIPPVMIKDGQTCDTITLCAGSSVTLSTSFLYSQQGQRGVLSAASPGFTGFSVIDTSTATNSIGTIRVKITPTAGDAGVHVLNIKAADKNFPALTNIRPFVVVVNICTDVADDVRSDSFGIYPNPGTGNFTIQIDDKQLAENCEARIFDVLGNVVYAEKLSNAKTLVDLSDKANGFYFLGLYSEDTMISKEKFIIQ